MLPHLTSVGALVYGCRPHLIGVRCMRRAYGVNCATLSSSWPHTIDPAYAEVIDHPEEHVPYVYGTFKKLVAVGDPISILDIRTGSFCPGSLDRTACNFGIYCTGG